MFVGSPVRPRLAAVLALAGLAVGASATYRLSSLLAPETVRQYEQAASEARRGRTPMAMAMLEGLLLDHPVTIAVAGGRLPAGCAEEFSAGVSQGIDAWARAIPDSPFRLGASGERADVTIAFVPEIENGGGDVQGLVKEHRHYSWRGNSHRYEFTGTIEIRDRAFGHRLNADQVGRVLAHELGHVLGLGDDYDGPGVMGAFRADGGPIEPSRAEVAAVTELRANLRNILRHARGA